MIRRIVSYATAFPDPVDIKNLGRNSVVEGDIALRPGAPKGRVWVYVKDSTTGWHLTLDLPKESLANLKKALDQFEGKNGSK